MKNNSTSKSANADRKNEILMAGLKTFCEKSYESTTIDDITKKAKCSHGLFYHYFKSKRQLFNEILSIRRNDFNSEFNEELAKIKDYREKLKVILNKLFSNLKTDDSFAYFYFFFISQCFTHRDKPKKAPPKCEDNKTPPPHIFYKNLFSEGQREGYFTKKYSPRECSRLLLSIIQGVTLSYVISPKEIRLNKHFPSIDFIIDIFDKENE
ncbi:MAG: TetR/AcrR family transcriptional regulator [Clostridia bacterium]|nr:TetR/AcrR family transcriptional regulator [Clostridia bacterium]